MKISVKSIIVIIFVFLPVLKTKSQTSYSFTENWVARYYTPQNGSNKSLQSLNSPAATININTSDIIAPVLSTQFGANITFRNGADQRSRAALYEGVITTMRYPAGSGSNTFFWDGKIPLAMSDYYDQTGALNSVTGINGINSNFLTPDILVDFKKDINGEPIVVVNYFYARYGITSGGTRTERVKQAADYAAAFVKKLNIDLNAGVKYWEIGNECYGKWEVGFNVANTSIGTVTGKEYGEDFVVFANTMKAVDPTIKIGAVVKDIDEGWNAGVLPEVKNHADFLSVHDYFTTVNDATASNILDAVGQIGEIKTTLQNCVTKYTGKNADYFPLALTEFNSRGPYNCSMINGLFITQILGEIIKNKYGLSCLWVSEWNWNTTDLESKGFLAKADPDQADYTPRQSYIPFYYYKKCFGDNMINSVSTNTTIKSYASTFSNGFVGVILVNTSATTQTVKLNLINSSGTISINKFEWYEFYANTIEPTVSGYKKFYINTNTSTTTGGGPANLDLVKPFTFTPASKSVFNMQPYSVYFIVASPETLTTVTNLKKQTESTRIIPFDIKDSFEISDKKNLVKAEILNLNASVLLSNNNGCFTTCNLNPSYYLLKAYYNDKIIVNKFIIR